VIDINGAKAVAMPYLPTDPAFIAGVALLATILARNRSILGLLLLSKSNPNSRAIDVCLAFLIGPDATRTCATSYETDHRGRITDVDVPFRSLLFGCSNSPNA
jgi:hypothetical protein